MERTWIALGGPAVIAERAVSDVETFLGLLAQSEHDDAALADLEQRVASHWAAPQADPRLAVQLMTMHKAKGLQFDVVILPSLLRKIHPGDTPLLRWEDDPELGLLLAPRKAKGGDDAHHDFLGWIHKQKDRHESGRLLYVACTRARHELHLLAAAPRDATGAVRAPSQGLLSLLWPGVRDAFTGEPMDSEPDGVRDGSGSSTIDNVLRRLPADWQAPQWEQWVLGRDRELQVGGEEISEIEFSWAGEEARHVGVLVHEFLQLIAEQGLEHWDHARLQGLRATWRQELAARGLAEPQLGSAVARVEQALDRVLADPRAQWLLGPHQRERCSEYAVSVWRNGRVRSMRMDLTFIDEQDRRWIVDYKSSTHEGGDVELFVDREVERYRAQLRGYAEAMAQLDPRPIYLALYFPLLQAWREWRHS
jgi:ATP-dependent exoDNAse (exonuclease V) beta subunit